MAVPDDQRTVGEVLLKLFILQFSTTVAIGHLGSLRKLRRRQHAAFIVISIFYPLAPLVDTIQTFLTFLHRHKLRNSGFSYILSCIAGASALYSAHGEMRDRDPLPLVLIDPVDVETNHERERFSWKCLGRIIVLLAFLAQVTSTFVLIVRRTIIVGIRYSGADIHTFVCCVSGLGVGLVSIIIQLFEDRWRIRAPQHGLDDRASLHIFFDLIFAGIPEFLWSCQIVDGFSTYMLIFTGWAMLSILFGFAQLHSNEAGGIFLIVLPILVLFVGSVYAPFIHIVMIQKGFNSINSTAWQWKDSLSSKLWVY